MLLSKNESLIAEVEKAWKYTEDYGQSYTQCMSRQEKAIHVLQVVDTHLANGKVTELTPCLQCKEANDLISEFVEALLANNVEQGKEVVKKITTYAFDKRLVLPLSERQ